jgi:hypothetical protein
LYEADDSILNPGGKGEHTEVTDANDEGEHTEVTETRDDGTKDTYEADDSILNFKFENQVGTPFAQVPYRMGM